MTKRTLAALCALLAFMAVLAVVPLATAEPAEAHERTRYRCAYDPFAGRQCWSETVAHTHRTIPDNPPPDTAPKPKKCPTGTTGTPPNCSPVPSTNENRDPDPPITTTTTAPPRCPAGQHSNGGAGRNCHSHSFTPPCGTGTWSPGHGHSAIQRPPCPKPKPPPECADGYSGTPPNCKKIDKKVEPPKCPTGQTGTPPNCTAPNKNGKGESGVGPDGMCLQGYSGTPPNCMKISGTISLCHTQTTYNDDSKQVFHHRHDNLLCHTHTAGSLDHPQSGIGSHAELPEHMKPVTCPTHYTYSRRSGKCELSGGLKIVERGRELVFSGTGQVICSFAAGGAAKKAAEALKKGGNKVLGWLTGKTVEWEIESPCDDVWTKYEEHIENQIGTPNTVDPEDDDSDDESADGHPSGTDDDSGEDSDDDSDGSEEDEDPEPTPGICDRNSAPTNPYKIGPSNTTPQQWADWWAWFDCP